MSSEYQAYLLRLQWKKESASWRVILEDAHTGKILRFSSQMELLRHLFELLSVEPTPPNPDIQLPEEP